MKEEALKVANRLNDVISYLNDMENIPTEITDRILQAGLTICLLAGALDIKPLDDDEKVKIADGILDCVDEEYIKRFARAIEERHGIK